MRLKYSLLFILLIPNLACTKMAKNIGYIEPSEKINKMNRNEFEFCSLVYPRIIEKAFDELKIKSKKETFENVSIFYYPGYVILQCVNINYD